jgi:hypothetical protein
MVILKESNKHTAKYPVGARLRNLVVKPLGVGYARASSFAGILPFGLETLRE